MMAHDETGGTPTGYDDLLARIGRLSTRVKELERTASAQEQAIFCLVHHLVDADHVDYEALRAHVDRHAESLATHPDAASPSVRGDLVEVANKLRSILPPAPPDDEDPPKPPQLTIIRGCRPEDGTT